MKARRTARPNSSPGGERRCKQVARATSSWPKFSFTRLGTADADSTRSPIQSLSVGRAPAWSRFMESRAIAPASRGEFCAPIDRSGQADRFLRAIGLQNRHRGRRVRFLRATPSSPPCAAAQTVCRQLRLRRGDQDFTVRLPNPPLVDPAGALQRADYRWSTKRPITGSSCPLSDPSRPDFAVSASRRREFRRCQPVDGRLRRGCFFVARQAPMAPSLNASQKF